ncbi:hypothetical protein BC332_03513 [Capsicum chinense]|nr:hypothetical protein BC332_03513 [Capsicum chinense]
MKLADATVKIPSKKELPPCLSSTDEKVEWMRNCVFSFCIFSKYGMVYSLVSLSNMKLADAKGKIPSKEELSPCLSSTDEIVEWMRYCVFSFRIFSKYGMVYSEVSLSNIKLANATVKIPSKEELSPCLSSTDEIVEEQQVSIILYGDDIPKYDNLFGLFETYLVSCAKVREPHNYLIRSAMYEWVADRYTIVEAVTNNNGSEVPLLAPTKLDTLSFSAIEEQRPGVEFDLLAVVVNCSAIQYTTDQSKHFREVIVIDQSKKPFLFTIWGDLADNEGATLLHHLHEYPVILARRIDVTEFRSALRLATRYQSTILTNPQYVQATALTNWCYFKVNIVDASDTITVMISETLGEKMLSLTSEQIYELVAVQLTTTTFWWPLPASSHGMFPSIDFWGYLYPKNIAVCLEPCHVVMISSVKPCSVEFSQSCDSGNLSNLMNSVSYQTSVVILPVNENSVNSVPV